MKHRRHFDPDGAALREAVQIGKMISDLDRLVRILDCDIATEEERAGVFDRSNGAYPELARTLAPRRDNLRNTIAALEQRLPNLARRFELTSDLLRID
jgi:ABC-type transporter Mla subunit MlaD